MAKAFQDPALKRKSRGKENKRGGKLGNPRIGEEKKKEKKLPLSHPFE